MNAVLGASLLIANAITAITAQTVPQQSNSSSSIRTQRCNTAFFESILVNGSTLVIVDSLDNGSAYGQGGLDLAYPAVPTNLPACCAAIINVTSSPTSAYQVAIFLPDDWNDRFLVVGNGGFGGGINWEDMASRSQTSRSRRLTCGRQRDHTMDLRACQQTPAMIRRSQTSAGHI